MSEQKYSRPLEQIQYEAWEILHDYFILEVKADPDTYGFSWIEAFDYGEQNNLLGLNEANWSNFKKQMRDKFTAQSTRNRKDDPLNTVGIARERLKSKQSFYMGCKVEFMKQYVRTKLKA